MIHSDAVNGCLWKFMMLITTIYFFFFCGSMLNFMTALRLKKIWLTHDFLNQALIDHPFASLLPFKMIL